jgi:hypothetical protein
MRTRERQRIYKRFMAGESINGIYMDLLVRRKNTTITYDDVFSMRMRVEQAIRDVIASKIEFYESWTGVKK